MLRLFFALQPDDAVRGALAGTAAALQRDCGGRPPDAENLHLTLAFLGDVPQSRLPALFPLAAAAAETEPFAMALDRIGWWPRQRLVWAGARTVPLPLRSMSGILAGGLRAAGFRTEKRRFLPHVTLLRDARRAPPRVACSLPPWRVSGIVLLCSERGPRCPRYHGLREWPLPRRL
ncbi:MAG: RNA 2',3'-cyclic phosphodiesterase [Burkholderiales bacterium]|nr:RNA 2',3'-cyclic phosphodiesterase [Burkholderiales bacterium]